MKGLIVYKTMNGSAECYAKWIQEETGFEALPVNKVRNINSYDVLIIGSCVRMGSPSISGWIKKNWPKLKDKKLILFTTSGAQKDEPELQTNFEACFPDDIRARLPYFPLNGKIVFSELRWLDRTIMNLAVKMMAKSDPEKAKKMALDFNGINRNDIKPIVEYIVV